MKNQLSSVLLIAMLFALLSVLSACGQRGPLHLPAAPSVEAPHPNPIPSR